MASDSHNKIPNRSDNVVSLSRHEFVANIERKLTDARRLFSLHDYGACEEIVLEVLAVDPSNTRARALLELASVKLSKKKLYQKMVDPKDAPSPSLPASAPESPAPSVQDVSPAAPAANLHFSSEVSPEEREAPIRRPSREDSHRRPPLVQTEGPPDTMRERTISALVELLKQRDRAPEDWRQRNPAKSQRGTETASELSPEHRIDYPSPEAPIVPKIGTNSTSRHGPAKPSMPAKGDFLSGPSAELLDESQGPSRSISETAPAPTSTDKASSGFPTDPFDPTATETNIKISADRVAPSQVAPFSPKVVHLPDVRLFEQVETPHKVGPKEPVEQTLKQRSDEFRNSEIKTVSVAQIKKHLYQEEYELCARELEQIRRLFPRNAEIQAFVENTSKRLTELQRIKAFESQAKDLMASAVAFYQEGKLEEALIAAHEVLRVNPNYLQAREFVTFVERRQTKEQRREYLIERVRYCKACGTTVDAISQFCCRCGKRLN
jgi:hypothetical protein